MIRVLIASRGRPTQLAAALWSLWVTTSVEGRKNLMFAVSSDHDDDETTVMVDTLSREMPVVSWAGPRPKSSHALLNTVAEHLSSEAAVVIWNDRLVCVSPFWDTVVEKHVQNRPTRIGWWGDKSTVLTGSYQWVMPPAYLQAIDRKICPEIFPFWFDDLWHHEIDWFISQERTINMIGEGAISISSAGIHKTTRRGREFRFWTEVFIQTRPKRLAIASVAAARLGLPWKPPSAAMIAHYEKNDRWQLANAAHLEAMFGDKSPPEPEYIAAKASALEHIGLVVG